MADDLLDRFQAIKTWKRGDQRAPHKPLLILLALGRIQRREDRLVPFQDVEQPLAVGKSFAAASPIHP